MSSEEPAVAATPAAEADKPTKKIWPKKLSGKTGDADLIGRVSRILVKTDAATVVELSGKKGTTHSVTIEGTAAAAMLAVATAALVSGGKLHVRTAKGGSAVASAMEIRSKR